MKRSRNARVAKATKPATSIVDPLDLSEKEISVATKQANHYGLTLEAYIKNLIQWDLNAHAIEFIIAKPATSIIESAEVGANGKMVIVCATRTSQLLTAAAWLDHDGDIAECLTDTLKRELNMRITDWPNGLFPEPKQLATAAA